MVKPVIKATWYRVGFLFDVERAKITAEEVTRWSKSSVWVWNSTKDKEVRRKRVQQHERYFPTKQEALQWQRDALKRSEQRLVDKLNAVENCLEVVEDEIKMGRQTKRNSAALSDEVGDTERT